jgi:hypothetical protein
MTRRTIRAGIVARVRTVADTAMAFAVETIRSMIVSLPASHLFADSRPAMIVP